MYPNSIQKLIDSFSKFPTVGPRTASRFVFYLLKLPKEEIAKLISAIADLKNKIKLCEFCFNPFESFDAAQGKGEDELCEICKNGSRDKSLLSIVEKESDLISLENTKKYKGRYFILGGTISALKKADIEKLRIKELQDRIKNHPEIQEIILAINPTAEGEATALYLERLINELNKKTRLDSPSSTRRVTRLGRGLPVGAELEYADEETLSSALEGRK